jgi:hypothetical protein
MKRISFDKRFVNEAGNDLIPGNIHTIRRNYEYWKRFEGKEVALFTWEGKPYRSKQRVFCVKRIVNVQEVEFQFKKGLGMWFSFNGVVRVCNSIISENDGFESMKDFYMWFWNHNYNPGKMAILHFTEFKY